jgi:chromosome segregation protein
LKFSRLRLSGFKSFVDPTELFIEHGLTGVVGPNGCGKSNLLEALRWVMGENRPTSMRGAGMEDVIFSGTGSRPMRNNAEVTLVIDNTDRSAPSPYTEFDTIEVSRRIERDAGSIYRINGRDVRQRDVQIFFADAATGSSSPALVRQGHIGILINQKPLSRRAILEEAAGIGGLHQRRHEADLRLKAAETNLARLDDIISEVEGQLQGLKRQARQAVRYRNLSGVIHKAEAVAFYLRWKSAEELEQSTAAKLEQANAVVAETSDTAAKAATARVDAANTLPPLRNAEAERAAALQRLMHERDALDAEVNRAHEEAQRIRQRIEQAGQDRSREQTLEQDAASAIAALEDEARTLQSASASAEEEFRAAAENAASTRDALAACDQVVETLTAQLAELNARRASYQRTIEENSEIIARVDAQLSSLTPQQLEAEAEIEAAPDVLAAEVAVDEARRAIAEAKAVAENAQTSLVDAERKEAQARSPFDDVEREVQRLSAEAGALATLLQRVDRDLWPPLIDSLRVEPGYEPALAAALGDDLDAPLDEAAPQHWRDLGALSSPATLPNGVTPLSTYVDGPHALARRLAYTGVVTPEQGAALHCNLLPGQRLVTQRGDLWRWDGYCVSADAKSAAANRLAQRNRLEALEVELKSARESSAALREVFSAAQRAASEAREAAQAADRSLRSAETALMDAQDNSAKVARAVGEKTAKLAAIAADIRSLRETRETALRATDAAKVGIATLADIAELQTRLSDARTRAGEARAVAAESAAAFETLKAKSAARAGRLAAIADDETKWVARREAASQKTFELDRRLEDMKSELAEREAVPSQIEDRRNVLLNAIATAETARSQASDMRAEAEQILAEADRAARTADGALAQAREERAAAQAHSESAAARLHELRSRIQDELDATPQDLFEIGGLKEEHELPSLEQADARIEKLKREREQLGGVNLRAEEEANDHEQRLKALQIDREDLEGAIQRLRRGIQTLNREGRERLLESFEKVNANFERLFKELFQGGEARLTFTESDDPLEAGLEILAKPPGKKLTTLSLLSGGEQALTAISLIFAVFLVNPAPICVLDEVDAPLDDANVDRFCRLLDEMTRLAETRFLIITHHALTMSRMNRLFGVTMAERGVSQLVSVSLDEAERVIAA